MKNDKNNWLKRNRRGLLIGGPVLFLLIAGVIYFTGGRYISTDDAYVQAATTQVSANISARVVEVAVHDNQKVRKGDLLFKLDDREFVIAVADAQAKLASAKLDVGAMKATYLQRVANAQAAKDTAAYQQRELNRQEKLAKQGISSKAQLDQARHDLTHAQQELAAAEQQQANALAALGGAPEIAVDDHPTVQQAQAALDRAELDLSYTVVTAPSDGIVAKVEQLQAGNYVNAAKPLFSLMSDSDVWVEANFKETELVHMRPGQHAVVKIDSYAGKEFKGVVESTSPGTGSSFSLLPPENATGNWVKVVQRVPVRIRLDQVNRDVALHAGLSAKVEVDTEYSRLGGGRHDR
ncbi:HlyD family efflux transporter periplasmic adaptor subunit [bacterium]|nr:HlyD family efflux transporter periplasmic adaptor subunit [bacterium]